MTPPILGIWASAVTGGISTSSFESIATVNVGSGGSSSITFSSIPSTYTHLQIRGVLRSNVNSSGGEYYLMRFNGDNGASNYFYYYLGGNGTTAYTGGGETGSILASQAATYAQNSIFGANIIDILDYTNTNIYKSARIMCGYDLNGSGVAGMDFGTWKSTSAITSITILPGSGTAWTQYSRLALYGIKAA